jgi:Putative zinc-finger
MSTPLPLAPHLRDALLVASIDDELSSAEAASVASHLSACHDCFGRYQALRQLSANLESAIAAVPVESAHVERERLARVLQSRELTRANVSQSHVLRRLSYALAIAAAIAFALMFAPQWNRSVAVNRAASALQPSSFQLDGETFVALPYSNPDLPLNSSHIVRMQVPVSSLADAGVVFEPISNEISAQQDRSVLADVLLGIDGQPLGVHVLSSTDN